MYMADISNETKTQGSHCPILSKAHSSLRKLYAALNTYSSNDNPALNIYESTPHVNTEVFLSCPGICRRDTDHCATDISKYSPLGNAEIAESNIT
jgi:hypothetical protein